MRLCVYLVVLALYSVSCLAAPQNGDEPVKHTVNDKSNNVSTTSDTETLARIEVLVTMIKTEVSDLKIDQVLLQRDLKDHADETETKLDAMEDKLSSLKSNSDDADTKLDGLEAQVDNMKQDTSSKLDGLKVQAEKTEVTLRGLNAKVDNMKQELDSMKAKLALVESQLNDHSVTTKSSLEGLSSQNTGIKQDLEVVNSNVDSLEEEHAEISRELESSTAAILGNSSAQTARTERILADHFHDFSPKPEFQGSINLKVHSDCAAAYDAGWTESGVYRISPNGGLEQDVYCEMELDGGGWTVFQRRINGSLDFDRTWEEYKFGFGNPQGEYWMGNEILYQLTNGRNKKLKVELHYRDDRGNIYYADYNNFSINSEYDKYQLFALGYVTGTAGNGLSYNNEKYFTTKDKDNDSWGSNCAASGNGGWWYGPCSNTRLNHRYGTSFDWYTGSAHHDLLSCRMLVK